MNNIQLFFLFHPLYTCPANNKSAHGNKDTGNKDTLPSATIQVGPIQVPLPPSP